MEKVVRNYLEFFKSQYPKIVIPRDAPRACVIVEPRRHPHLEFVLKNIVYFLPDWSLYIFHSDSNEALVRSIVGPVNQERVHFHKVCRDNLTVPEYNRLLTRADFWKTIHAEDILIFQTDSYIRRRGIESFLQYGFPILGAPWKWCRDAHQGGNGGFSLRKKSAMLCILSQFPYSEAYQEDVFFHLCAQKLGYSLAHYEISQYFSMETMYASMSYATHKSWAYGIPFLDICIE